MDIEDHGRFYIERQTIRDNDGRDHAFFDVGEISFATGVKRYKVSNDVSFKTRDAAIEWIQKQKD
ncbi:hypothetical protein RHIZ_03790 [Rhizobium skierniewicense]|uniref:hypothetical protein n=1 Tax=Rhizobium skierniewicense TaxID=984260 RepID=UPI001FAD13E9|nr:hypothetical protein [Rhizobium skierniewicense]MCI9865063.1 hypothetical protein [Rhizobium skierniewicense]